jgi:hypothetical protein
MAGRTAICSWRAASLTANCWMLFERTTSMSRVLPLERAVLA